MGIIGSTSSVENQTRRVLIKNLDQQMKQAAIDGARRVNYLGVGTIEFLVDKDRNFYFMEMNTRIQVEHPITEEAYEVDLLKDQLRVALGEKIEYHQENIKPRWASIECRINAEDVENNFRPTPGKIEAIHTPGGPGVRIDKAVYAGYFIPPYYDSMIAKLIVRARTRKEAITKMSCYLDEFVVEGIPTTIPFHKKIFSHPDFVAGNYNTSFLEVTLKEAEEAKQPKEDAGSSQSLTLKQTSEESTDKKEDEETVTVEDKE